MHKIDYINSMNFLVNKKSTKSLPDKIKENYFRLDYTINFSHKSGIDFKESYKDQTLVLEMKIEIPNERDFVLFNKLEKLIFEFLDKQESKYND